MREVLTFLAGLLVAALMAALVAPGFIDWRDYRPQFEARLSAALGIETRIAGPIGLRLLPSPHLDLTDVRIGEPEGGASAATIERLSFELALSALARGEFRLTEAQAQGMTLSLVSDESGALVLPHRDNAFLPAATAIERLGIRRSRIVWREPGKPPVGLSPISVDVSAVSLAGPWRIEGEAAGASLRIATGALDASGQLRTKASMTGEQVQLGFDGALLFSTSGRRFQPSLEGAFTLSPGGAVALSGQASGDNRGLELSGLVLDIAGGAARLEGEGRFLPADGSGTLHWRARRIDADALGTALAQRRGAGQALAALPGRLDLTLDIDQLAWRGEDFSGLAVRGRLTEGGLDGARASVRVAGAEIAADGGLDENGMRGRLVLKAPDARRTALTLARLGLDAALADSFAALFSLDASGDVQLSAGRLAVANLAAHAGTGSRLSGEAILTPARLEARLRADGFDLAALPPGESLSGLVGTRELALDLTLGSLRYRDAPPGSAALALTRKGADWRLTRLAVAGFGDVAVEGDGALSSAGGEIRGRVRAPRFQALAALAGPVLPEATRRVLPRIENGLARLDAAFRIARSSSGETTLVLDGRAQAGQVGLNAAMSKAGEWAGAELRVALLDRLAVFAALGLPLPAQGGAGTLTLSTGPKGTRGSLVGQGLALALDGEGPAARLTLQAETAAQILPDVLARLLPAGPIDASGKPRLDGERALDDLVVNSGGLSARGALTLSPEGRVAGRLDLPELALAPLLGAAIGDAAPGAAALWAPGRFQAAPGLGDLALALTAGKLRLTDTIVLDGARLSLASGPDGLVLDEISGRHAGGEVSGRLSARRDGGLAQLAGRLELAGLDLAPLTGGALSGRLSGRFEAGGAGESPARLVAGLGGAGSISVAGAAMTRFDPAALSHVIATTGDDASESETPRLQARLAQALERASWPLGDVKIPFTQAGGVLRVQPVTVERGGVRADASGFVDWRAMSVDLRLALRPTGPAPKGWPEQLPQIGVAWRGPLSAPRRETDVGALSNVVAARALAKEIERVEAFEADQRERAFFVRRLRAEREMRENERKLGEFLKVQEEKRLEEERKAEEARRVEAARLAEEARKAELQRRQEEARRVEDERRRAEAEERARQRVAQPPAQPGPLVLPGAAPAFRMDEGRRPPLSETGAPPLPPPLSIEPVPRPLSRQPLPN